MISGAKHMEFAKGQRAARSAARPHVSARAVAVPWRVGPAGRLAALLLPAVWAAGACDAPSIRPPERPKSTRSLVLVGDGEDGPLHPVLLGAATSYRARRPELVIRVLSPRTRSPVLQQQILTELATSSDDAVVVLPLDAEAITATLNRLAVSGKPVVTALRDAPRSDRAAYSGASEPELGRLAGAAAVGSLVGRSQSIVLMRSGREDPVYRDRYASLKEQLSQSRTGSLMDELDCGGNPLDALQLVRRTVRKYPRVGAWIFLDDWPLRVLEPRERLVPIGCAVVVCGDGPALFPRVRTGEIQALVTADLHTALVRALEVAFLLADGTYEDRLRFNPVPAEIITLDDLDWHEARWAAWRKGQPSPPRPGKQDGPRE